MSAEKISSMDLTWFLSIQLQLGAIITQSIKKKNKSSQQTPHSSPFSVSYGVFVVSSKSDSRSHAVIEVVMNWTAL